MKRFANKIIPFLIFVLFIFFPKTTLEGAKSGLLLWYSTIIPTLLPFIIISRLLLHASPGVILLGFFCGYPISAQMIDDRIAHNQLTTSQGNFFLWTCNNLSIMFLSGFVCSVLLKGQIPLLVFLSFIYVPILLFAITYLIFHPTLFKEKKSAESIQPEGPDFDETMLQSFFIIMKIGGYMMLFSIAANFLMNLPLFYLRTPLIAIMEVTTGVTYLAALPITLPQKIALIAASTSFGGLCSLAQTKSVLVVSKLSISRYIIVKILLSSMSYLCVKIYFLLM